jgi:hypothetical protein
MQIDDSTCGLKPTNQGLALISSVGIISQSSFIYWCVIMFCFYCCEGSGYIYVPFYVGTSISF